MKRIFVGEQNRHAETIKMSRDYLVKSTPKRHVRAYGSSILTGETDG